MKNKIIFLILISTSLLATDIQEMAEVMPNFQKSLYLGIVSNNTIVVAVGERGHIGISDDYGATWTQAKSVPTKTTLTAVSIVNNNIWAVGHDTTILYSPDAGKNWSVQFEDKDRQMPLLDVLFINESDGFAIGAYGTYLTTFDGGKNWTDSLISTEEDYHLNKIIRIDEFKYFVVAEAGKAYRSFDAGKNWESLELPYPGSMFGAIKYQDQIITYGLRGHVLVSSDFGESFIQLDSPILDSLFGAAQTYTDKVLLVGANGAILQYKNMAVTKVDLSKSDGDYTGLLPIKNHDTIFIGESGISTKQIR